MKGKGSGQKSAEEMAIQSEEDDSFHSDPNAPDSPTPSPPASSTSRKSKPTSSKATPSNTQTPTATQPTQITPTTAEDENPPSIPVIPPVLKRKRSVQKRNTPAEPSQKEGSSAQEIDADFDYRHGFSDEGSEEDQTQKKKQVRKEENNRSRSRGENFVGDVHGNW